MLRGALKAAGNVVFDVHRDLPRRTNTQRADPIAKYNLSESLRSALDHSFPLGDPALQRCLLLLRELIGLAFSLFEELKDKECADGESYFNIWQEYCDVMRAGQGADYIDRPAYQSKVRGEPSIEEFHSALLTVATRCKERDSLPHILRLASFVDEASVVLFKLSVKWVEIKPAIDQSRDVDDSAVNDAHQGVAVVQARCERFWTTLDNIHRELSTISRRVIGELSRHLSDTVVDCNLALKFC